MTDLEAISPDLRATLTQIYEVVMWLARRPKVTASSARSWYTHIMAERVKRDIRQFTGSVSAQAVKDPAAGLRLEHYLRIQTTLTNLVERHRSQDDASADEFIHKLIECEQVHIVTVAENYAAMRAKGDYASAGIELVPWKEVAADRRADLWRKMLRGRVANAAAYAPSSGASL